MSSSDEFEERSVSRWKGFIDDLHLKFLQDRWILTAALWISISDFVGHSGIIIDKSFNVIESAIVWSSNSGISSKSQDRSKCAHAKLTIDDIPAV